MSNKKWDSKTKFMVVLEGLKEKSKVSDICNRHGISQTQYYKWRDQFLSHGIKVLEYGQKDRARERLKHETMKLKAIIGDLTTELKKNEYEDM